MNLIVRADGFGLAHAVNQAIEHGFEAGLLTCASLAVVTPWLAEAAALCRDHREWEIGVQLSATCSHPRYRWRPVCGPMGVPSLVDSAGCFCSQVPAAVRPEELARELAAQLDQARAWGIGPAFVHCADATHPVVAQVLPRLCEEQGLPLAEADWGLRPLPCPPLPPEAALEAIIPARSQTLISTPPGNYLWITNPALSTPESWAIWPDGENRRRQADAVALTSPVLAELVRRHGIELLSFRQYLEMRLGTTADE